MPSAELGRRLRRLAAMVAAVADEDQVGVAGCQLAEGPPGRAQRRLDRGPVQRDRIRRGVPQALEEQLVVAGQRAEHVGAAGESQQPEPRAALPLHRLDQLAHGGLGALQPVRPGVLGEHAVGHVEQHDHVPAEQRQRARPLAQCGCISATMQQATAPSRQAGRRQRPPRAARRRQTGRRILRAEAASASRRRRNAYP